MESIPSGEKFGLASLTGGEAPRHTEEGHETCAYYNQRNPQGSERWMMECPHLSVATGAFYSEDLINEIRRHFQFLDGVGVFTDEYEPKVGLTVERLRELLK